MTTIPQDLPNIGAWRGGWLLARASWSALKLDKELIAYPLLAGFYSLLWIAIVYFVGAAIFALTGHDVNVYFSATEIPFPVVFKYLGTLVIVIVIYLVNNYYLAALIASAIHRFNGGNPNIAYGLGKAKSKIKPLIKFSLLQGTVGWIFQIIDEKLPLAGRISASIIDLAWRLAIIFAIPVIVMSDRELGPIEAVKESAALFKKTWAKNFTAGVTMGLLLLAAMLAWIGLISLAMFLVAKSVGAWTLVITAPVMMLGIISIAAIFTALNGIFIAALYYYATTGQSPAEFDHNMLLAAFKPKKNWFA